MYLLKKVFQLRDKSNPDMEKPFLEHLEDLRIMITRVVVTLLVSTIGCFVLQERVMDLLRKPAEDVWESHVASTLPDGIDVRDWETARNALKRSLVLPQEEREPYLAHFDEPIPALARAAAHLHAARGLPEEKRGPYLDAIVTGDDELKTTIARLNDSEIDPDPNAEPNLKMMSALKPAEPFMLSMKLAFFAGVVVSFPFLLFFILQFVLPGLHNNERKILWPAMAVGFGLFLIGVLFAYFIVLPRALAFFFDWGQSLGVASDWRIGWYISFATQFTLLFGLSFELPVIIMALVKIGLLNYEMMSRTRSYAVLAIVVLAAMITPTGDLITLSMMAVPMYVLYEICILLAWFDRKKQRETEQKEEEERLKRLLDEPEAEAEAEDPYHDPYEEFDDDPYEDPHEESEKGPDDGNGDPEEEDIGDDLSGEPLHGDEASSETTTDEDTASGSDADGDHDRAEDDRIDGPYDPYDPYDPDHPEDGTDRPKD